MEKILVVTTNPNKVREFKTILEPLGYSVYSLLDIDKDVDIVEDGETFAQNAAIKAEYGCKHYHTWSISDDSGLCIDALDGRPGIYSARFLGKDTPQKEKNQKILELLKDAKNRNAQFHCCIALARPDMETVFFEGILKGEIAYQAKGEYGFGYDPIFYNPDYQKTNSEMTTEEKLAISHRGQALRMLVEYLEGLKNEKTK